MRALPSLLGCGLALSLAAQSTQAPIRLAVDASDAPRHLIHAHLSIPAKPGALDLVYPKWIPGEHGPTGPLQDLVGLHFKAKGQELAWRRDDVEMYEFHLQVPQGAERVELDLDFLIPAGGGFSAGPSTTEALALISWNQLLLYPMGAASDAIDYEASITLPAGWKYATALELANENGATLSFKPVSLTTLVDSPLLAGAHFKRLDLGESLGRAHHLDIAADAEADLAITPETLQHEKNLVAESGALFGARHYGHYDFLLTLSDDVAHFGLEHHQSSDDRVPEHSLTDPNLVKVATAGLLPHEMVHSWNGKYRRPAGLATGNYDAPMKGELLWVYEGLTQYLGSILTGRSGLWSAGEYRDNLAMVAAALDDRPGRAWRPLEDTAVEAQVLYNSPGYWSTYRRGVDFYDEGLLIWLDADTLIREQSKGKKSLDDFCKAFHGGENGGPALKTYTFADVVAALNAVQPYDWAGFLDQRIRKVQPHAPLDGLKRGGWKLVFTDQPSELWTAAEAAHQGEMDATHSIGLRLAPDGGVVDVVPGSAAFKAGLIPGMKLLSVNGLAWSAQNFHDAMKAGKDAKEPIAFTAKSGAFVKQLGVDWHGGERFPHLERAEGADLLSEILKPHAK